MWIGIGVSWMLLWFFHDLALLLLFGFSAFAFFSTLPTPIDTTHRNLFVGIGLGVLGFVFMLNPVAYDVPRLSIDGRSGPLILAGYLGGPIAAGIASVFAIVALILTAEPALIVNGIVCVGLAFAGVVIPKRRPERRWPDLSLLAIAKIMLACLLAQSLLFIVASTAGPIQRSVGTIAVIFLAGLVSTGITAATLKLAKYFARRVRRPTRFELATRSAGLGVFVAEAGEDTMYLDAGTMAILGMDRDADIVPNADWLARVHPDDVEDTLATYKAIWAGSQDVPEYEFRICRPNGQIASVRTNWFVDRGPDGDVRRIIGVAADITDMKEVHRQRHEAETRLAEIANNLPGVLMSFDVDEAGDFRIAYVSDQCEKLWGYTAQDIVADKEILVRAHDPDDLDDMLDTMRQSARQLVGFTRRHKITDRAGNVKWLEDRVGTPRTDGNLVHMDGVFLDVTREVEAQAKLIEQTAMTHRAQKHDSIGQLTGGVAHDFNNLLAVVLGNLELLRDEITDEDQVELIDNAIAAIYRGADLTRNMLAFARKATLEPKTIDLNKFVRDTKNWAGRTLPANILIETSLLAGLWPVKADPSSTESALLNLILNARDAMEGGGKLTIETANVRIDQAYIDTRDEVLNPGRYVMLAVSDTGHGIPDDKIEHIFEPFYSTKAPGSGSGLGLSMVEGFMRQSNGTVQVYSEDGVGTTFKLYFPVQTDIAFDAPLPAADDEVNKGQGRRLLVAEDEAEVLRILVATLERAGYVVTPARSGDEAKRIFDADPNYDLLLTDIVMPGDHQGTTLSRALREIRPDLPVIFMSGYASEATVHGNGLRPEDIRLMKPVGRDDLLAALRLALRSDKG